MDYGSLGRAYCYKLCQRAKWQALVSLARQDLETKDTIVSANNPMVVLSEYAKAYLNIASDFFRAEK